jgi:UDP-glucose 4-epimerase
LAKEGEGFGSRKFCEASIIADKRAGRRSDLKALVTGAAGFIGSHLCGYLLKEGLGVVGVDSFLDFYPRSVKEANIAGMRNHRNFEFIEGSLLGLNLVKILDAVDVVFHQAAQAGVRASWGQSFKIYSDNNILATQMLLEACRESPVKKFIYASSSSVYGDTADLPMREDSIPRPVSPYGVSKLAGEHLCYLYYKAFSIPTVSLRYFTVYGARQRPDMAFHRFFRWVLENKSLKVYGDGEQSRDFTHVDDIMEANRLSFEKAAPGEVFNIGGGSRISLNRVIPIIHQIAGRETDVCYEGKQKGDVRHTFADMTKAQQKLGYKPKVQLQDGLRREYEWVKELVK